MSENTTYASYLNESVDDIHERMLSNAPSNINTIQGDPFWDDTRPAAEELARFKNNGLKNILLSRFPQTAIGEDLDACGLEDGVSRKGAEYAIQLIQIEGTEGTFIEKDRILCTAATEEEQSVEFKVDEDTIIDNTEIAYLKATCTVAGIIGNVALGKIKIMAKSMVGIKTISNIEIIKKGVDIEEDESYRERILDYVRNPGTSGNVNHYRQWALSVAGVGAVKVFPLWNGNGTVKVVIADTEMKAVTQALMDEVKEYIDENNGTGDGMAPIGATLTVTSAVEKEVNISAKIIIAKGYTLEQVQSTFNSNLTEYLRTLAFKLTYVSLAQIGNILLNTVGVIDYSDLKINNLTSNLALADEEIAVVGTSTLEVAN